MLPWAFAVKFGINWPSILLLFHPVVVLWKRELFTTLEERVIFIFWSYSNKSPSYQNETFYKFEAKDFHVACSTQGDFRFSCGIRASFQRSISLTHVFSYAAPAFVFCFPVPMCFKILTSRQNFVTV